MKKIFYFLLFVILSLSVVYAITAKIIILNQSALCPNDADKCTLEIFKNNIRTNTISITKGTDVAMKLTAIYSNYIQPVNGYCGLSLNSCLSGTLNDIPDDATDYLWSCSGAGGGTTSSCSLPKAKYTLNVGINPSLGGDVSGPGINCGNDCSEEYIDGTSVTLTASSSIGYSLSSWAGCNSVNGNQCNVIMDSSKSVTANFVYGTIPKPDKIILLQMDDCQIWWLRPTCINLANLHIQKQADLTIGFVPQALTEDVAWKPYLQDWYNNYQGRIEIAEHSYDHSTDYSGWSISSIVADMNKGKTEFAKWGIYPKTFIPAFDWSTNVADASNVAGFKAIMDGLENPYDDGWIGDTIILEDGVYCGDDYSSCPNKEYSSLKTLVDQAIVQRGYAIILFHQQDFGDVGTSKYNTLYAKWSSNLDKFKADGYVFMTANEYRDYKFANP